MKASTISGAINSAEPRIISIDLINTTTICQPTNWSVQQRSRVGAAPGVELYAGAEIKVTELDRNEAVAVHAEDVLGLQVSVGDALGVEELKGRGNITNNLDCFLLSKEFPTREINI